MTTLNATQLRWFNERYATVVQNGDFFVIRVEDGTLFSKTPFLDSIAERKDYRGEPLGNKWLGHRGRRHYSNGMIFDPSLPTGLEWDPVEPPTAFNTWRGWQTEPVEGDTSLFDDFALNVICDGIHERCEWVLDWIADLLQSPADKPGTALVLLGGQGIGKSVFANMIGDLTKPHSMGLNDPQQLMGRFGEHLVGKVFVFADEGSFAGRAATSKLKNLITADEMPIEPKGRKIFTIKNPMRVVIATNDAHAINASFDERRYAVIQVSHSLQNDHRYFGALVNWWSDGGKQKVMHKLLHRRYDKAALRIVPATTALLQQKIESLDAFDAWIMGVLWEGYFGSYDDWQVFHPTDQLQHEYVKHVGNAHLTGKPGQSRVAFGQRLKRALPGATKSKERSRRARVNGYRMPALINAREDFERLIGHRIDWPKDEPEDE